MSHNFVHFNNISFSYPDGNEVLRDICLQIHHGESVGIIGPNGAGKSTLLTLLVGILSPCKGSIYVGQTPVTRKTLPLIRQRIGITFQDADNQLFMTTVYDDVAFGPRNYKYSEEEVEKRVIKALDTVGITHLKSRAPYKLSGGEKRAATIATVLSMDPDILLMDEPTAALDPKSRRRLIHLLMQFSHTKIITSHDLDMILETCERTIVLSEGKVVADGPTIDILTNKDLMEQSGLEIPLCMQNCPVCQESD